MISERLELAETVNPLLAFTLFVSLGEFTETTSGQGMKVLRGFLEPNSHSFQ